MYKSIETKQLPSPEDHCSVCRLTEKLIWVMFDFMKFGIVIFQVYKEIFAILYASTQSPAEVERFLQDVLYAQAVFTTVAIFSIRISVNHD